MNIEAELKKEREMAEKRSELLHLIRVLASGESKGMPAVSLEIDKDTGEKIAEYSFRGEEIYIHQTTKEPEEGDLLGMVQINEKGPHGTMIRTFEYGQDAKVLLTEVAEGGDYGKEAHPEEANIEELKELIALLEELSKDRKEKVPEPSEERIEGGREQ